MSLVLRLIKGSVLTYEELDDNFTYLDGRINVVTSSLDILSGSFANYSSSFKPIISLNNLTSSIQYFNNDTNLTIISSGSHHTLTWSGSLADSRISSSGNWNIAFNQTRQWDGGATGLVAVTGRTSLGLGTWATLNYPTYVSGTPFVKMTAAGTFSLDTDTYYSTSNPSGFTSNTGTVTNVTGTSPITVTNNTTTPIISIADGVIANVKLANSTISGISLGSSLANLTIGSELISGGSSTYNGSAAKTLAIQSSSITNNMLAGSIDLTTKVTGVLPLANGGTGSSTKNFVDLTTTQTVAGNKTLTGITTVNTDITSGVGVLRGNQYSPGFANSWSWASTSGVLCGVVGTSGYVNTSLVLPSVANEIYGGAFGSHSDQGNAPGVGLLAYGKATAASCYGMKVSAVGQSYDVSGASGYGVYVSSVNATYQNNYGIYINSVTNGIANNYGIYQKGGTKNYFVGTIGIGQTSPTAFFHIKAGTASASSAPLKFTTGVASQTTKEAGAVNYDGSNLTLSDATYAYTLSKTLTASATLNFPSTAASSSSDLTITVTGVSDGDVVSIGVPNVSVNANSCYTAWVSAADTVTIRFNNYQTVGAIDPASGTFKVSVIK